MPLPATTAYQNGKTEKDRLVEGEKLLSRYTNGAKVSELIEEFGLSRATVHRRLTAAINARIAPTVDEYREVQNAMLDEQMAMLDEQLDAVRHLLQLAVEQKDATLIDKAMSQRLRTIEVRTKVAERRARLMGLDQPVRADVQVTVTTPLDTEVEELLARMTEADRAPEAVPSA